MGTFRQNIVHFNTSSCSPPYCNSPPYLCFLSFTIDMHIVGHALNAVLAFLQLQVEFATLELST
jgi:hypothetical protein